MRFLTDQSAGADHAHKLDHIHRVVKSAKALAQEMGLTEWDVSLTHTAEYASAVAVAR